MVVTIAELVSLIIKEDESLQRDNFKRMLSEVTNKDNEMRTEEARNATDIIVWTMADGRHKKNVAIMVTM